MGSEAHFTAPMHITPPITSRISTINESPSCTGVRLIGLPSYHRKPCPPCRLTHMRGEVALSAHARPSFSSLLHADGCSHVAPLLRTSARSEMPARAATYRFERFNMPGNVSSTTACSQHGLK
eukprot:1097702-Pleurochrysis_carterae.AAC.2